MSKKKSLVWPQLNFMKTIKTIITEGFLKM